MECGKYYLKYNLQMFAEGAGGEKTEEATPKKLSDARKEGQVAKSMDIVTAFMLLGLFLGVKFCVTFMGEGFLKSFNFYYTRISQFSGEPFTVNTMSALIREGMKEMIILAFPLMMIAFIIGFVFNVAQVKWKPTLKPLMPKLNKFDPISGFKKMFSKDKIMELLKSIMKVSVLTYVVYDALKNKWNLLFNLYHLSFIDAIATVGDLVISLGIKISIYFLAIAAIDFAYQKIKFSRDMRMTKQELKDEFKNSEGDPQIKGRIKQKMREVSQRRMMQALPEADVVITNPTHLAVAIKYDRDASSAPTVIAKGADFVAQKMKDVAREHDIEIVENKPLARMLYYNVEIDQEIPQELYQAVAEILAYVYGLKGKI